MKKLATFIMLLMAFASCEKEPEDLLLGAWKHLQRDITIGFQEDGTYSWGVSYNADPNSGRGSYETKDNILKIKETPFWSSSWSDSIRVTIYNFTVSKNALELINLETNDTSNYERVKRNRLF